MIMWYEKSSKNGSGQAANSLPIIYSKGHGVSRNLEQAVQYWKLAASRGNVLAMESFEKHFFNVNDMKQAKYWSNCAKENGSVVAAQNEQMYSNLEDQT